MNRSLYPSLDTVDGTTFMKLNTTNVTRVLSTPFSFVKMRGAVHLMGLQMQSDEASTVLPTMSTKDASGITTGDVWAMKCLKQSSTKYHLSVMRWTKSRKHAAKCRWCSCGGLQEVHKGHATSRTPIMCNKSSFHSVSVYTCVCVQTYIHIHKHIHKHIYTCIYV